MANEDSAEFIGAVILSAIITVVGGVCIYKLWQEAGPQLTTFTQNLSFFVLHGVFIFLPWFLFFKRLFQ
jgi:uncharacterized membrane protein